MRCRPISVLTDTDKAVSCLFVNPLHIGTFLQMDLLDVSTPVGCLKKFISAVLQAMLKVTWDWTLGSTSPHLFSTVTLTVYFHVASDSLQTNKQIGHCNQCSSCSKVSQNSSVGIHQNKYFIKNLIL